MKEKVFTEGCCEDGAAILCNGQQMPIEHIVFALNTLAMLLELKDYKDLNGKDDFYLTAQPNVWAATKDIVKNNLGE